MKPKFKDFDLPIKGRRYQILYDPNCPDVTYEELKIFIMRLKQEHRYEDVAVLTERYDYLLAGQHARTKKFNDIIRYMVNNGEKIKNIEQISHSTAPFLTDTERSILNGTYENPSFAIIQHVAYSLRKRKMDSELTQLLSMYKDVIIEGNRRLLEKYHGSKLPENYEKEMESLQISQTHIDGMTPLLWKTLNVPDFIPQKAHLKHLLKELKQQGKLEEVSFLENKYEDLLIKNLPEPELSSEEANALLEQLLSPEYHSIFEKQITDKYFVDEYGKTHYIDEDGVIIDGEHNKEEQC